jgi:hypothetical protein
MPEGEVDVAINPRTSPVELANGNTLFNLIGESTHGLQVQSLTFGGEQYEATVNLQSLAPRSGL